MPHIKQMTDKPRSLPWRAHINRKGHKPIVKMFKSRQEADQWASEQERSIRLAGLPLTIDQLKKHTVKDIVTRYLAEVTPSKGCSVSETTVLKKFLRTDLAHKSLAYVSKQDGYTYINNRLKEIFRGKPIKPSTVRREINSIQHVFEVAKEQWGLPNLTNPFRGIAIKGSQPQRERRLKEGELQRLVKACKSCHELNRLYLPLGIYLAVETGMRLQEVLNLTWPDLDLEQRRIDIRKSKTDNTTGRKGRTIVMSAMASIVLERLQCALELKGIGPNERVFPMTKDAYKQAFAKVVRRAKISDLHFHDLRHEAASSRLLKKVLAT
ncbi:MAG: tyrosine-type recombinase/integrase, partial [Xanthobacteraceae bacterium]